MKKYWTAVGGREFGTEEEWCIFFRIIGRDYGGYQKVAMVLVSQELNVPPVSITSDVFMSHNDTE